MRSCSIRSWVPGRRRSPRARQAGILWGMRSARIISGWRSAGFKTGSEFQGIESREERTGKREQGKREAVFLSMKTLQGEQDDGYECQKHSKRLQPGNALLEEDPGDLF